MTLESLSFTKHISLLTILYLMGPRAKIKNLLGSKTDNFYFTPFQKNFNWIKKK